MSDLKQYLPADQFEGTLIGRVWMVGVETGPAPVIIKEEGVYNLTTLAPTTSDLFNLNIDLSTIDVSLLEKLGNYEELMENALEGSVDKTHFISPFDIQAIKACGVTFMVSMLERVIEERAGGDASKADALRGMINDKIGGDVREIVPGSKASEDLKEVLQAEGMWSQYMEVGIGPYAEVFTKAQPMSSVGVGAEIGILPISEWNNPEPEIVLAVNGNGEVIGATLGNDVNLRDIEGRSALLLGKAKDNNASCAIGPFIRIFDDSFSLEDVRKAEVRVLVQGKEDGFILDDKSDMTQISRDVLDLVGQTFSDNHQYPDGFALFTGTLFAPTKDRGDKGNGFTHKVGDVVSISSAKLGMLTNTVNHTNKALRWTFGISELMKNLTKRGVLTT
ncbi:fumarylacetoacetate hydrolase family protein [Flammeovirga aprica]|uniref:Fumarylacetoacetate hydrolase family protein n=1 Tax=Flammeovirga aprica JL-4 TaxID=694437 RepID=A0A7X9P336_9BACT|nr:fumarylacetoacetate hydrolase family protein [Flammeovirga aprica]NME68666.1 fumarylacetoacetate hydrolase family protein [Flammeovirga aprica JL-4]